MSLRPPSDVARRAARRGGAMVALTLAAAVWVTGTTATATVTTPAGAPPPTLRAPAPGPVRDAFRYRRATPFAAGQRRGMSVSPDGARWAVAPCAGRVSYAGRTPRGTGVVVRCGSWAVTVLGVTPTVRGGATVARGGAVGRTGARSVWLSLRPAHDRFGYVDPQPLLVDRRPSSAPPLGPAPRRGAPTVRPAPRPVALAARRMPSRQPVSVSPRPVRAPALVWVGLVALALGLPVGGRAIGRSLKSPVGRASRHAGV